MLFPVLAQRRLHPSSPGLEQIVLGDRRARWEGDTGGRHAFAPSPHNGGHIRVPLVLSRMFWGIVAPSGRVIWGDAMLSPHPHRAAVIPSLPGFGQTDWGIEIPSGRGIQREATLSSYPHIAADTPEYRWVLRRLFWGIGTTSGRVIRRGIHTHPPSHAAADPP